MVIGLTGPTGAGKSTVAEAFAAGGCAVVDADVVARTVVENDRACLDALAKAFGGDILDAAGRLNRHKLADRAFSQEGGAERLNAITHPPILRDIEGRIAALREKGQWVVLDAPLLLEGGCDAYCDKLVVVLAPEQTRIDRVMERDGITEQEARLRIAAQKDDAYYQSRADAVLQNTGGKEALYQQALALLACMREDKDGRERAY